MNYVYRYSCEDIDECKNDPTLCENGNCVNTAGGYECDCDMGFTRSKQGRSCLGQSLIYSLTYYYIIDIVKVC